MSSDVNQIGPDDQVASDARPDGADVNKTDSQVKDLRNDGELDMSEVRIDPAWALKIPASLAMRKQVMPLCLLQDEILVACADIEDATTQRQLAR